ncbi:hypothetical protein Zmor_021575 [Zophobas morio]|uniref:Uncharacterized protein n=1 Tax=Zophobas morio TaxID=2755281 RepID=A0AA38I8W0_9CUCU|nr:hypothetical protein Zmor_021575 [Zophobas morio]
MDMKKILKALHAIVTYKRGKEYWEAYNCYKQIYLKKIQEKIREENMFLINSASNKARKIWEIINGGSKAATKERSNLNAEGFNTYLKKMEQHPLDLLRKQKVNTTHSMFLNPVSEEEITKIIMSLKSKTTRDIYDVSTYLIKTVVNEIVPPLTMLINQYFAEGYFDHRTI